MSLRCSAKSSLVLTSIEYTTKNNVVQVLEDRPSQQSCFEGKGLSKKRCLSIQTLLLTQLQMDAFRISSKHFNLWPWQSMYCVNHTIMQSAYHQCVFQKYKYGVIDAVTQRPRPDVQIDFYQRSINYPKSTVVSQLKTMITIFFN